MLKLNSDFKVYVNGNERFRKYYGGLMYQIVMYEIHDFNLLNRYERQRKFSKFMMNLNRFIRQ